MAGRGYNIVGVNLAAVFKARKDISRELCVVLWENDTSPIIAGRELLGAPKLYADIPDPLQEVSNWKFHCSLYGTRLVEGEILNAAPLDDATRGQIEQTARGSFWMGWKYIPQSGLERAGCQLSYSHSGNTDYNRACSPGFSQVLDTPWESAPVHSLSCRGCEHS